ncbi:probable bifunctional peptidase and (3S)-lysyl hydroxylase Jmjd7 at N-terminal half [Coccomyxa sp. Obi]|nr:probable bifunctional peptidase and (3S)-lysyl hydroxylase Jmjd7 at N-terminal half [Coccomyxa sp. Obi]
MGRKRPTASSTIDSKRTKTAGHGTSTIQARVSEQPLRSAQQESIPSVDISDITPDAFWSEYISQRKPVLIRGQVDWGTRHWQTGYLESKAGGAMVNVEKREDRKGRYGEGRKVRMRFGDFLTHMAADDDTLYLTTQEVDIGQDGQPELYAPPVAQLASDFPVQPSLLGNLVPHQINLWMGCAPNGASSGLHHDFHDNLYVLLHGRKRFALFPPSLAKRMYTSGRIRLVHPNGRIVYEGRGDVMADGSDAAEVARWRQRRSAEAELEAAEVASARGEAGAAARLAAAEQELDTALEAFLDEAAGDDYCGSEDGSASDDSERNGFPQSFRDDYVDSDDEGATGDDAALFGRRAAPGCTAHGKRHRGKAEQTSATAAGGRCKGEAQGSESDEAEPDSFSRVDLAAGPKEIAARFRDFPGIDAALQVEVQEGEMLYLPAGWFHEVKSFGRRHMALNYWAHPPDNLDPGPAGFSKPYKGDYWPSLWAERKPKYEAATSGHS